MRQESRTISGRGQESGGSRTSSTPSALGRPFIPAARVARMLFLVCSACFKNSLRRAARSAEDGLEEGDGKR